MTVVIESFVIKCNNLCAWSDNEKPVYMFGLNENNLCETNDISVESNSSIFIV